MHETGTSLLTAIDAGKLVRDVEPDTPELWLAAAELAAYVGDADEARADLRRAGNLSPALRLRARCIEAELCIEAGDTATGELSAMDILSESLATGDRTACVRARVALVRAKVRDGRYRSAIDDLPRLRREIESDATADDETRRFRLAIADHLEAYSRLKLGDAAAALDGARRAIAQFVAIEAIRWEGWSRNVVGLALVDQGDHDGALREFERAEACAAQLGLADYMLMARNNAATVAMAQNRIADAAESLRGSLAIESGTVADAQCRILLAECLGIVGRATEARSCAARAVELADQMGHDEIAQNARIVATWLDGDFNRLHQLKKRAETMGTEFQIRACLIFMADVAPAARPERAERLLVKAEGLTTHADELSGHVERIRARLAIAPIRVEGDTLTLDLSRGVPHLDDAIEAVERLLLECAMRRGEFVQRRAARLLGISATRILYLRKKLDGSTGTDSER